MDTLDRFLIKEFLIYYVVIHLSLAALFLGVDFMSNFWDMHMALAKIAEVYGYKIPAALQQFFPMSCLMATLLVLSNMSRQNEVLALYASGVGNLRLISTLIAAVATLSTVSFLFYDSTVPMLNKRRMMVMQGLDPNSEEIFAFRTGFWYRSGKLVYEIGRFLPEKNAMEDVNVYTLTKNFQLSEKIHAKEAHFVNNDWTLSDGFAVSYPRDTHFPESVTFKIRRGVIREKPGDFRALRFNEETMRLRDLRTYIKINHASGLDTTALSVGYHERVAAVFTPLIFVLFAIPFALKPMRNEPMLKNIGLCFAAVFGYLLVTRMSVSIGKGGHIPPLIAAWAPNVLFLGFAIFMMTGQRDRAR